jgi:N-methylhydantoinase B
MSNTLSTPTEALELAYPLRIRRHALRLGSGGEGTHRGGNGVIREIEALEPCHFSVVSERRRHFPEGVEGGDPGQPGRNLLNGEERAGKISGDLARGDVLTVETPGGGGHGRHSPAVERGRACTHPEIPCAG